MDKIPRREREKLRREEEIIDAAEKIFCNKGYDNASMDEIAFEAQFTKSTLYSYFSNKEDLYFATVTKGYKALYSLMQNASRDGQTGFIKITQGSKAYYRFFKDHPQTMKLMNYIGYVKKSSSEDSPRKQELMQINSEMFQSFAKAIHQGQADGSIRADVDALKVTCSLIFMLTGFFNQISVTGQTFITNFSLDMDEFCFFSLDLLFNSIKNTAT